MHTILFVLLDDQIGGTPMRILKIAGNLDRQRFRAVAVIPPGTGDFGKLLEDAGITVYRRDIRRLRYSLNPRHLVDWIINLPSALRELKSIIARENVDVVHAFGLTQITGPLAAKQMSRRIVWQINDLVTPFSGILLILVRHIADRITVSSDAVRRRYFSGISQKEAAEVAVLYSAIGTQEYSAPASLQRRRVRDEFGTDAKTIVIGTVGNVNRFKGHMDFVSASYLIKSMEPERKFKFVVVGQVVKNWESYYRRLQQEIRRRDLAQDFVFTGKRLDVPDLLSAMDIYMHPSLSESFGLSIIEAMAAGRPIVATKVGGVPEIIPDDTFGILVPPSRPRALADAALRLIRDPAFAGRVAEKGRERALTVFGIGAFMQKHHALYDELIQRKGRIQ